jgi:hypothetical protein
MDEPVQTVPARVALQVPRQNPLYQAVALETEMMGRVMAAVEQLQRVECLDEEQRAEIQTILEAMQHDSHNHSQLVADLSGCYQGRTDA